MAAYRQVYDSYHLQADYQEPGSALEPYVRQSSIGYLYFFTSDYLRFYVVSEKKPIYNPLAHPTWKCTTLTYEVYESFFMWLKVCIVLAFFVLAFSIPADSYSRFPYLRFPVLVFSGPPRRRRLNTDSFKCFLKEPHGNISTQKSCICKLTKRICILHAKGAENFRSTYDLSRLSYTSKTCCMYAK